MSSNQISSPSWLKIKFQHFRNLYKSTKLKVEKILIKKNILALALCQNYNDIHGQKIFIHTKI